MTMTVIQHVLARLKDIGITDVFGVPGDYSFPVNDAICDDPAMRWIGCCNEQNAAYAADGYARIKGVGALCTTFGVGELGALNGIAGAYAEHLPLFHLVGMPSLATQSARAMMHHTLGDGEYDVFRRMSEPVVCAQAVMTPWNVARETERLIAEARYHRRPVYMGFPADAANQPVLDAAAPLPRPRSDPASLEAAANAIVEALSHARSACVLPGILVARTCQRAAMKTMIEASNLPFATMFMAKSVLDEQHPNYVGMYDGALMNPEVRDFVEGCDKVLVVGSMMSDFNTGAFTARLDPFRTITIRHHRTEVGGKIFANVEIGELLAELARRLPTRDVAADPAAIAGAGCWPGRRSDQRRGVVSALGQFHAGRRYSDRGDRDRIDGSGLCPHAARRDIPQSDAVGFHRLGNPGRVRRRRSPRRNAVSFW